MRRCNNSQLQGAIQLQLNNETTTRVTRPAINVFCTKKPREDSGLSYSRKAGKEMEELVLVLKIMDKLLEVNSLDLEDIETMVGNHLHKKGLKISKAKTTKQYFVLLETQEDKKA